MSTRLARRLLPCLLVIAVILPLCGLRKPVQAAPRGEKYAFLIGVSAYESTALRELPFAENDATAFAKLLGEVGYSKDNIVLMTATRAAADRQPRFSPRAANIRKELGRFLSLAKGGDSVIVALAGHGVQFKDDREHYFCPIDADLGEKKNLIAITELYGELEQCKADVKLLLVDACRDDPFTKNVSRGSTDLIASKTRPQVSDPPGGVAALFSCSKGEQAFESEELRHGIFFHFVLDGLRGQAANPDGAVTVSSLVEHVSRKVPQYAFKLGTPLPQTPEFRGRINAGVPLVVIQNNLPREFAVDLGGGVKLEMARIPAGTFTMGSPQGEKYRLNYEHQHEVEVTCDFHMGMYEVTQEQYEKLMGANPSYYSPAGEGKDKVNKLETRKFPVETVTWHDAVKFCQKLNDLPAERAAGRTYRLPTEAEWEYACRGGATSYQGFGLGNSLSSNQANFNGDHPYGIAAKGPNLGRATTVGSYKPNGFGLHDMHGNVWEWCADWYDENYYKSSPRKDPMGPPTGIFRALRGGSYGDYGLDCRSAIRGRTAPGDRGNFIGFRVVCSPSRKTP